MRRLMRRLAAAALTAVCLVSLSACTAKQEDSAATAAISTDGTPVTDAMGDSLKLSAVNSLGMSDEQLIVQEKLAKAQGDISSAQIYRAQLDARGKLGSLKDIDLENAEVVMLADGSYTVSLPVIFRKGTMLYVLNLNMATQEIQAEFTDIGAGETDGSVGALMESASVYSAIGIGTVFAVLIFISLLIACFKLVHKFESGVSKKEEPAKAPVKAAVPVKAAAPDGPGSEDLSGDLELAAVITAAIAAYEGTSSNGLVVRSIRRVQGPARR